MADDLTVAAETARPTRGLAGESWLACAGRHAGDRGGINDLKDPLMSAA